MTFYSLSLFAFALFGAILFIPAFARFGLVSIVFAFLTEKDLVRLLLFIVFFQNFHVNFTLLFLFVTIY